MYEQIAIKEYLNHKEYSKALAAGKAMDNALKLTYSKGGTTNTHFMFSNFFKYFCYERLPKNR